MRVVLQLVAIAEDRPAALFVAKEATLDRRRVNSWAISQDRHHAPGAGRAFDLEVVAVVVVEPLERLDDEGS